MDENDQPCVKGEDLEVIEEDEDLKDEESNTGNISHRASWAGVKELLITNKLLQGDKDRILLKKHWDFLNVFFSKDNNTLDIIDSNLNEINREMCAQK